MRIRSLAAAAVLALSLPTIAQADVPDFVPDVPVLGAQVPRGKGLITRVVSSQAPSSKTVDGDISDWSGDISRFGGTSIYSRGEFVYQDYINDNWGADGGADKQRAEITGALEELEPRTYRAEVVAQLEGEQAITGQCGSSLPAQVCARGNYGDIRDTNIRRETDIEEVRVAADGDNAYVLVRTTAMTTSDRTGVLAMFDTNPGEANPGPVGLTTRADAWVLAAGSSILDSNAITGATAATDKGIVGASNEYFNAVEISVPLSQVNFDGTIRLAVATCYIEAGACKAIKPAEAASDLMNVAFRPDEPARIWMDSRQAFALYDGDIDRYLANVSVAGLLSGRTESFDVRPGYYERVYVTDSLVNREAENSGTYFQGQFQHYGIYFPTSYRGSDTGPYRTTWWSHYRGGHAHDAAAWVPGLLRHFGEDQDNIVITPSARGTSTWYVGRGMEDFLDVWDDSTSSFPIDENHVYMSGYSMGGYASWLLPTLMPDRFAGSSPQEGPATQGLFVAPGVVTAPQNGGDVEAQNTYNILENARNVPYVIYNGNTDELVWITGVAAMHAKLTTLGYNNRLYQIDGGEHFAVAIFDQWDEAATYLNEFRRDPNPPRVTYRTWPAIEYATSTISTPGLNLGYRFNSAYWVSDLEVRAVRYNGSKPDPRDWGTIDASTNGRGAEQTLGIPEAGVGVQGTTYRMTGWRNLRSGWTPPTNTFSADLTNLRQARLDLKRMGISTGETAVGTISTDGTTDILLTGTWHGSPSVSFSSGGTFDYDGTTLTLHLGAGKNVVTIG